MSELLNQTVMIDDPENMDLLSKEQAKQLYVGCAKQPQGSRSFRNEEQHTIISVAWTKQPLLEKMYSAKEILKITEKRSAKTPGYEKLGDGERTIGGLKMNTFRYGYTVQGFHQFAEYGLIVLKGVYYTFQLVYREGYEEFAESTYEKFLASVKLA